MVPSRFTLWVKAKLYLSILAYIVDWELSLLVALNNIEVVVDATALRLGSDSILVFRVLRESIACSLVSWLAVNSVKCRMS